MDWTINLMGRGQVENEFHDRIQGKFRQLGLDHHNSIFFNMSAILKRFVPVTSNASSVLRTRTAAVGIRMLSEGSTARDPGWSSVPLLALLYKRNQLSL